MCFLYTYEGGMTAVIWTDVGFVRQNHAATGQLRKAPFPENLTGRSFSICSPLWFSLRQTLSGEAANLPLALYCGIGPSSFNADVKSIR